VSSLAGQIVHRDHPERGELAQLGPEASRPGSLIDGLLGRSACAHPSAPSNPPMAEPKHDAEQDSRY